MTVVDAEDPVQDETAVPLSGRFTVKLSNFEGPFDLLLQLICQHEMDVTEVALHQVTDEFIAHIKAMGDDWDLDETTEFLVVAATLLDLKAARLLPEGDVEDEDDLALLEARDLLFARLLQYRAYKQVAALFAELEGGALRRYPRSVALEDRFAGLLPEVMLGRGRHPVRRHRRRGVPARSRRPRCRWTTCTWARCRCASTRRCCGCGSPNWARRPSPTWSPTASTRMEVVARFLALLELYREDTVLFTQEDALEELRVQWTGGSVEDAAAVAAVAVDTEEEYG